MSAAKQVGASTQVEATIKLKQVRDGAIMPKRQTEGASGYDLYATLEETVTLWPRHRAFIPCGFALEIPPGWEGQVRPRSGLASQCGVTVLNAPGTIDSDYRGEIGVVLVNHGVFRFDVRCGDRIAQLVFARVETPEIELVDELGETTRGSNGFGSTGVQ